MIAKCETETITISTKLSFFSFDKEECIFNVSFFDLDLQFLEL